jgi:peptide chain release factor 1
MFQKLDEVEAHYNSIEARLSSPEIAGDSDLLQKLSKEHSDLMPVISLYREYRMAKAAFLENQELLKGNDAEMRELALEENRELEPKLEALEKQLQVLLLPKDPNDDKNILLEIRAGAGGDEAALFVGELFRMYTKYAERRRWSIDMMSASDSEAGGFKEIICMVRGEKVYSLLKFESGVHRVQRVPKTETQGRIHTSTATVAVLPEAEELEVTINPNDLKIDVYRSSGAGGQSVNTTDSAVRMTHLPTGLVVACQDERSQLKNKFKAMKILQTRLKDLKQREQDEKMAADRKGQVGTGDRSEKIRTYNFPQGRVTDHRIGVTIFQIDAYMNGDIDEMISKTSAHFQAEALKSNENS